MYITHVDFVVKQCGSLWRNVSGRLQQYSSSNCEFHCSFCSVWLFVLFVVELHWR